MSFFYNGRLWTSPAVMSRVDDSAMYNPNLNVGNVLAVIGTSTGGEPNKAVPFGSAAEAAAYFKSGELVDGIAHAFDPSSETAGPATVIGVRVNPAVRSTLSLLNASAAAVIALTSSDYGLYTGQIKVKIESGAVAGKKLTTQFQNDVYTQDNVHRNALSVAYSGAEETGVITISNGSFVLQAPAGTTVATIALATYPTIQELVDRINSVADFSASVLDGNGAKPALNGLDSVTAQDVKTAAYTVKADLQAIVDWFNGIGSPIVSATREAGAGIVPANIPFTYLSGGSNGTVTNAEWSNAFTALQSVDVQWVAPVSADASIHAMADAHCSFMSNVGRMERRSICGTALTTSDANAIIAAKALNSDRTSLVHLGFYDYDTSGALVLYPPYILAALIAGAFSGVNPGTALTNKSLKVRGLERDLKDPTDTDPLINGGVLCVKNTRTGYRVVQSISTWLISDNFNRVEVSVGVALDFTARNVRQAVEGLKGAKGTPVSIALAASKVETTLRELSKPEPVGPGVLAGDAENPPYKGISVQLEGDVLAIQFQCSPVIPINYIPVTIYAVPYSGSASA
ncbi:hypothetical protein [Parvibaculum sp.]|uniref:hypothetical protein n=1 Tax=Parvibaculum sp. TaxID=2024848 RepID=UPI00273583C4|nr:hypothetical protein [Parvibaculum sp.]MDP3327203.1 hypothetical protein [Parvibaculum sp.]